MNDLVTQEISNRTKLIPKKWKVPQISCLTFLKIIQTTEVRNLALNLTKILICSYHILQASDTS